MQLIDGKSLAKKVQTTIATEVAKLKQEKNIVPGLAVILIGDDPASHAYVKMKAKACENPELRSENLECLFACQKRRFYIFHSSFFTSK